MTDLSVPTDSDTTMTPLERRSSASLALIFALRMLGLFLVLPVFALEARKYPGGDDAALVGMFGPSTASAKHFVRVFMQ